MRARTILTVAAGVLAATLAASAPAEASHLDWGFGVGFQIGGLHFRVGLAPHGHGHPGPYFLTTSRLHYRGYGCQGACFRRGGGFYHHASCPLLGFHFGRFGYGPDYFVRGYAPYRGYYGRGWAPPRHHYRPYGHYPHRYGWRDRYRSRGGHYYGDRHKRHRGRGHDGHLRHDRGRRDLEHHDRDRHFRDDRRRPGRGERGRDRDRPRRGARHTRPPG